MKKSKSKLFRISLEKKNQEKIKNLIEPLQTVEGVRISTKGFVNWIIEKHPDKLSQKEKAELKKQFYDEEWLLRSKLNRLIKAKKTVTKDPVAEQEPQTAVEEK